MAAARRPTSLRFVEAPAHGHLYAYVVPPFVKSSIIRRVAPDCIKLVSVETAPQPGTFSDPSVSGPSPKNSHCVVWPFTVLFGTLKDHAGELLWVIGALQPSLPSKSHVPAQVGYPQSAARLQPANTRKHWGFGRARTRVALLKPHTIALDIYGHLGTFSRTSLDIFGTSWDEYLQIATF